MKKPLLLFSLMVGVGYSLPLLALTFSEKVDQLIVDMEPHAMVGLLIQDPQNNAILYTRRAAENFYPASNTKLFTAAAALRFFGPEFRFQTALHYKIDKVQQGILKDNLYVVFSGAPDLTTADLTALIKQLKAAGIHRIDGNLVIDDTAYQAPLYAPGWTQDSLPWGYSAPVSAIILNQNQVHLTLQPAQKLNQLITVSQKTEPGYPLKINTKIVTATVEQAKQSCDLQATAKNNQLTLVGCWPLEKTPTTLEVALDNPRLLAQETLSLLLNKQQIALTGKVQFAKTPAIIPAVAVHYSAPLTILLKEVLAESNNLYAESLTKALGLAYFGQGSFQMGTQAIQKILQKETSIDFTTLHFSDGSGLSRYNIVSPQVIVQLLNHLYHDPAFAIYNAAFTVAGITGTLKDRLKSPDLSGKIKGKTGGATSTLALAGYVTAKNGKETIFSLMINQSVNSGSALKLFEEKLCQLIVEEPWA